MNTKKVERQGKELKFCRGASPSTSMQFKVTQCDSMRLNATQGFFASKVLRTKRSVEMARAISVCAAVF